MAQKNLLSSLVSSKIITSRKVLAAFRSVNREQFVTPRLVSSAYNNEPLTLGEGQIVAQPSTVATMVEALEARSGQKILEIGTGSGFQTAILSHILGSRGTIVTLERLPLLYSFGKKNLRFFENVEVFCSDGTQGYPYKAPYDRILVSADGHKVPDHLINQLKDGGILVIPVNGRLLKIQKKGDEREVMDLGQFEFVPLIGKY